MLGNLVAVRSKAGLLVGLLVLLVGIGLFASTAGSATSCASSSTSTPACAAYLGQAGQAFVVSYIVTLVGAGISVAALFARSRNIGFAFLFASLLLGLNDMVSGGGVSLDGFFHPGDLIDTLNNGAVHHEPFTLAFAVLGAVFILGSYLMPVRAPGGDAPA